MYTTWGPRNNKCGVLSGASGSNHSGLIKVRMVLCRWWFHWGVRIYHIYMHFVTRPILPHRGRVPTSNSLLAFTSRHAFRIQISSFVLWFSNQRWPFASSKSDDAWGSGVTVVTHSFHPMCLLFLISATFFCKEANVSRDACGMNSVE